MKKICILTSYAPSAVAFRGSLINDLVVDGFQVIVLAPDHTPKSREFLLGIGAEVGAVPMSRTGVSPLADLRSFLALNKVFNAYRPDIVLTYFAKPNIWGILAAFTSGISWRVAMVEGMGYIFTPDSRGSRTFKQIVLGWLLRRLYQVAFAAANRVIVLNPDDMRELHAVCGLQLQKVVLLGGIGVNLAQWQMEPPHVEPITFTMVARLLREKGVYEFLNAARIVKSQFPKVRFLLLGGLDENPGAIRLHDLQAWTDDKTVEFLGHVPVKQWLSRSSIFVLPSYREGVPRSTQEAMAMGLPVITTDVPGCRETVVHGVNGFLVQARESSALARAMLSFVENPELIGRMGRESRRIAEERFDESKANAKIMNALGL